MNQNQLKKLKDFYDEQIRNCEESLSQSRNKVQNETSKLYGEGNIRYKEGFRDALLMIRGDLDRMDQSD